jgi:hypothetical protein
MPFAPTGVTGSGPGTVTLRVDPDQVLRLRDRLDAIRDTVGTFLRDKAHALNVRPLGADPVSAATTRAFNENAESAIHAAKGFVDELKRVVDALDQAAKAYKLTEDIHERVYRRAGR